MTMTIANTIPEQSQTTEPRRRGRPPGRRGPYPSAALRSLAGAVAPTAGRAVGEALRRVWLSGFYAGAASAAPERVKRCTNCGEPFVAGHLRAIYCGARCRSTALKRRYRARLRVRAHAEVEEGQTDGNP